MTEQRTLTEFSTEPTADADPAQDLLVYHDVLADDVADVYEALVLEDESVVAFAERQGISVGLVVETLTQAVSRLRAYGVDIDRGYAFPGGAP